MKQFFKVGALFCGLLITQSAFAAESSMNPINNPATTPAQNLTRDAQGLSRDNISRFSDRAQARRGYFQSDRPGEAGVYYHQSYGQRAGGSYDSDSASDSSYSSGSAQGDCPEDHCVGDKPTGDCWCMYCHYEPCYYNTWRCVEKPVYTTKKCCRMVPKYYEVQRCKYVPQYYTETQCCQVPEYYDVEECSTCKDWVCDRQCKYVPKYYWKHVCENPCAKTECCE